MAATSRGRNSPSMGSTANGSSRTAVCATRTWWWRTGFTETGKDVMAGTAAAQFAIARKNLQPLRTTKVFRFKSFLGAPSCPLVVKGLHIDPLPDFPLVGGRELRY